MSDKNNTKVLIDGQVYTLSGQESEEYIQKVALYINNKLDTLKKSDNGQKMNTRLLNVLLALNIADELFKERTNVESFDARMEDKDRKIEALKNVVADSEDEKEALKLRLDELEKDINSYKKELDEYIEAFE